MSDMKPRGPLHAPRGQISCEGWVQEAALRMLLNNLNPDVAERPEDLVVYGDSKAAATGRHLMGSSRPSAPERRRDASRPVRQGRRRDEKPPTLRAC